MFLSFRVSTVSVLNPVFRMIRVKGILHTNNMIRDLYWITTVHTLGVIHCCSEKYYQCLCVSHLILENASANILIIIIFYILFTRVMGGSPVGWGPSMIPSLEDTSRVCMRWDPPA